MTFFSVYVHDFAFICGHSKGINAVIFLDMYNIQTIFNYKLELVICTFVPIDMRNIHAENGVYVYSSKNDD